MYSDILERTVHEVKITLLVLKISKDYDFYEFYEFALRNFVIFLGINKVPIRHAKAQVTTYD